MTLLGTLAELAERTGGRVVGDASVPIERISAIADADATTLTFAVNPRYLRDALASRAAAVLADESLLESAAAYPKPILVVGAVRAALSALLAPLEPPRPRGPSVDESARVDPSAIVGADVWIGPHVTVGARARIGDRAVLHAGVTIGADAVVGADALFHAHAYFGDRCTAGDRVVLQPSAVVGADGFGWAFVDGRAMKIPQVGIVALGDDVEIGANTCVDRAQTGATSVGEGTKIDNLVQIGHNCRIGRHCVIAALVGLAGSTTIGDYVLVGGEAAFGGHLTVGDRAVVAGMGKVTKDVAAGATVSGFPARDHREELRFQALLRRLPNLFARVDALESDRNEK
ncbi:MAG TPA: UDP-3-O-(3-hydroxymyristoyl)glucosamine N-acyltransferase [Candidatus Baltobacteraceae bacterium]|nr:UDP-3-O-(3-hydroxymyristoyl)glucosamine N-acyltransferase [Candidatus Baltobacteraceae bacterium]